MSLLSRRLLRLEANGARNDPTIIGETIDRPPQETREEWIARRDGLLPPDPPKRNTGGKTREQWIERRHRELELELCKGDPQ